MSDEIVIGGRRAGLGTWIAESEAELRQTGRTTNQMRKAPPGAIYVWPNHHHAYPMELARRLGRTDLVIVSPGWLGQERNTFGKRWPGLVLDHAVNLRALSSSEWDGLDAIRARIERDAPPALSPTPQEPNR